jgi:hypothetical protein
MLIIYFVIKGIVYKNSSWQTKQSIPHTTVTFYGDCVKMCEYFLRNFGYKRTGCCITTTHRLTLPSSPGNVYQNNMTVFPLPPYLSPRWKIKLKDRHFETTEVIEAESQAVLNTLM